MQAWPSIPSIVDSDIAVAATPTGATVFGVPTAGGDLVAFSIDPDGYLTSPAGGSVIRNDGPYTVSAAAYVDNTLIAAVVSSTRVLVNVVQPDLSAYNEIANIDGQFVGKQALMHASSDRITPTSCSAGLTVNPFDSSWTPMTAQLTVSTGQSTGIAAIPLGNEAIVAWSTATDCYVEQVMTSVTGNGSTQAFPCQGARLASDQVATTTLAFEASDGVRLGSIAGDQLDSATSLIAPGATSPRIVFDGTRTWISYVSSSGDVVVGFMDPGSGQLVITTLAGTQPKATAYELALIGGAPWIVSVDAAGYAGYKLCVADVPNIHIGN